MNRVVIDRNQILRIFQNFFAEHLTLYSTIVAVSVSTFILLDAVYPQIVRSLSSVGFNWLQENYPRFATADDRLFSQGFVEWFGTFYSFFLPLLMLRAWEQLDRADRQFDREADAIKILLEDILLLDNDNFLFLKRDIVNELSNYVDHILVNYSVEHIDRNGVPRKHGDAILQGIRSKYRDLIYGGGGQKALLLEPVTTELLNRLNDAIDTRGDRLSIFSQRLFESLRVVAIVTSVIWLIPFYFLPFRSGLLGSLLILVITFLIIFILTVINDLDEPFSGYWQISTESWVELQDETNASLKELNQKVNVNPVMDDMRDKINNSVPRITKTFSFTYTSLFWAGFVSLFYFLVSLRRNQK